MTKHDVFAGIESVFGNILHNSHLSKILESLDRDEKTTILIDGNNMLRACAILGFRPDFSLFKKIFAERCRLDAIYLFIATHNSDDDTWLDNLQKYDKYRVEQKDIIHRGDGSKKGDMDGELIIRGMKLPDHIEHVILVSGDGDFIPLVDEFHDRGKRVSLVGSVKCVPNHMSLKLKDKVDAFYELADLRPYITTNELPILTNGNTEPGSDSASRDAPAFTLRKERLPDPDQLTS